MLLTIETTWRPATDLGYLPHKNPARLQTFDLPIGRAHVCYPVAAKKLRVACWEFVALDGHLAQL